MIDISRETYERNGIETIVDNDGILWFNEKHIEEELDNKSTIKCHSDLKKHIYELVTESKKQFNRMFIDKKIAIKIIMNCRTTSAHTFRARLVFKQYVVILTKEQSALTIMMSLLQGENMQTQYNVLSYRIDLPISSQKEILR